MEASLFNSIEDDGRGTRRIRILDGAHSAEPLRVMWMLDSAQLETKLEVVVGKEARVVIVEELLTAPHPPAPLPEGEGSLLHHSVEIVLEEGAQLEFISLQRASSSTNITIKQRSTLSDNSKMTWRNVTLGAHDVQHDLQSEMTGANAISEIDWMFYAKGDEKYQLTARNIFNGAHGGGEITMKGVAEEKGHVRCDGMIEIGKGGAQTDTYLTQDVLMLDKSSKVDAVPGLEIKTNDVKASHSATVSRVTDEDLFYFAARGIPNREAKKMFVEGFLSELVARMSDGKTRDHVVSAVEAKYGGD